MDEIQFCKFISCDETRFSLMTPLDPLVFSISCRPLVSLRSSEMRISTTINFTPFTEHFYCMFRMTFSLNVDHNFSLLLATAPRILGCSLQTRPLKLVIKIRDHIFYLFSLSVVEIGDYCWRKLLPSGQRKGKFIFIIKLTV
jgi:hypothetical protein